MIEGQVVITVDSGQAGTVQWVSGEQACVLLRNGDIWNGSTRMLRTPQSKEELDTAPVDVERLVTKVSKVKRNRRGDDDY